MKIKQIFKQNHHNLYNGVWYLKEGLKKSFLANRFIYKRLWNGLTMYSHKPLIFEIHGADHCNLNCSGCTHYSPLAKEEFCDPVKLRESLTYLKKFASHFSMINILGGEPLLNPGIAEIFEIIRENFPHNRINVVSNGILLTKPDKLPVGFWEAVNKFNIVIRVTQYPIGVDYHEIEEDCKLHKVKFEITKDCRDTEKWRNGCLDYKRHNKTKSLKFTRLGHCYLHDNIQLVGDRLYPCAQIAYVRHLNNTFGKHFKVTDKDCLDVRMIRNFWQIRKLALLGTPFCEYCRGEKKNKSWSKSSYSQSEWLK